MQAGVRVFFYLEDRERTLDSALDKAMLSLSNFAAEFEREKARQRTHDALARKARALRPEADWLRLQAPKLRIVPEELWQTAHGRLERRRRLHAAGERSGLERPHEKYLLSGIAKCAACGGSLVAFTRDLKRTRSRLDRKSTRLNSSHVRISYAVFCLNKKTL